MVWKSFGAVTSKLANQQKRTRVWNDGWLFVRVAEY
jgi:hypothetical protein